VTAVLFFFFNVAVWSSFSYLGFREEGKEGLLLLLDAVWNIKNQKRKTWIKSKLREQKKKKKQKKKKENETLLANFFSRFLFLFFLALSS